MVFIYTLPSYIASLNECYFIADLCCCEVVFFPEDERSETIFQSIVETLKEKAKLLDQWKEFHKKHFGTDHDILSSSIE